MTTGSTRSVSTPPGTGLRTTTLSFLPKTPPIHPKIHPYGAKSAKVRARYLPPVWRPCRQAP